jgi:CTP:molybdopterin cytidylyltransferase MocA
MSEDPGVGAVILAAGMSRRYGSPKQLVQIDGRTLLEHVVRIAVDVRLSPVVAVVPAWLSRPSPLRLPDLRWIRNPFPERGIGLSLRLGLAALADDVSAAVILLGDQPGVSGATIAAILSARGHRPVVAATAEGLMAPPVLIEGTHFHLADALPGDVGLRDLLRGDPRLVTTVSVPGHPPDLDAPADLGRVAKGEAT